MWVLGFGRFTLGKKPVNRNLGGPQNRPRPFLQETLQPSRGAEPRLAICSLTISDGAIPDFFVDCRPTGTSMSLLSDIYPSDSATTANSTVVFLAFSFRSSRLASSFLAPITELQSYVTRSCYLGFGEDRRKGSRATCVSNCIRGLG